MYYYINLFFINSFLGFLLETGLKTFFFPGMNNGILFGPWIPVYGFGAVVIAMVSKFIFHRFQISKLWKTVLVFISVFFLLSLLEWLGGVLIEKIFHKVFWDYRDQKFNFGPYISYEQKNYKIPEGIEAENLNMEACLSLIELQKEKQETRKIRAASKKKKDK